MSHEATNWAIRQRGLHPATKLVLWHLADRHNPDLGCFPSQERLAHDAEVSRSQLNVHLRRLEEAGLLRREQRVDPGSKRQLSTRYILAFEADFSQPVAAVGGTDAEPAGGEPCPETGHGAVSGFEAEPCPVLGPSRVRKPDTNLVREPLREPCARARERVDAPARAGRSAAADRPPETPTIGADPDGSARLWGEAVAAGRFIPPSAVSPSLARRIVELGIASSDQLKRAGVSL